MKDALVFFLVCVCVRGLLGDLSEHTESIRQTASRHFRSFGNFMKYAYVIIMSNDKYDQSYFFGRSLFIVQEHKMCI